MKLGCNPDPIDNKDILLGSFLDFSKPIPDEMSYFEWAPIPGDQGKVGSCVGWGCSQVKMTVDKLNNEYEPLSPLWLYDKCKQSDDDPYAEGTVIRAAMRVMAKEGCCPSRLVPDDNTYYFGKYASLDIDPIQIRPFRIRTYARLLTIDEMCRALAQNGPFAMGIQVTDEFETTSAAGFVPVHFTKILGGHCIGVIGYNLPQQWFLIINSWNTSWANGGFAKIPFEYWQRFGMDAWGIIDISPNEA
jgi:hypothetical protein